MKNNEYSAQGELVYRGVGVVFCLSIKGELK